MKKQLSLLIAVFIVIASFAGCSKKAADSSSSLSVDSSISDNSSGDNNSSGEGSNDQNSNVSSAGGSQTLPSDGTSGGSGNSGGSNVEPEADPLEANLQGQTIEIVTPNANGIFNTKKNLSSYQNACAERMATLQSKLNCKIRFYFIQI